MAELTPAPTGYPIKLVRDKTPEIINASGKPGDLWYDNVSGDQLPRFLKLKLAEELGEYLVDGGDQELVDIYCVLEALAWHAHRMQPIDLMKAARDSERGGFLDGVVMYGRHEEFDQT